MKNSISKAWVRRQPVLGQQRWPGTTSPCGYPRNAAFQRRGGQRDPETSCGSGDMGHGKSLLSKVCSRSFMFFKRVSEGEIGTKTAKQPKGSLPFLCVRGSKLIMMVEVSPKFTWFEFYSGQEQISETVYIRTQNWTTFSVFQHKTTSESVPCFAGEGGGQGSNALGLLEPHPYRKNNLFSYHILYLIWYYGLVRIKATAQPPLLLS